MSNTTVEVVASLKVPVRLSAMGVITTALSKEYGPGLYMRQNGKFLEFVRDVHEHTEAKGGEA